MTDAEYEAWTIELGELVREAREAYNLTQREFAQIAGVDNNTVGRIERAEGFSFRSLMKVLDAFDLDLGNAIPAMLEQVAERDEHETA